jgi:hypothetical protein
MPNIVRCESLVNEPRVGYSRLFWELWLGIRFVTLINKHILIYMQEFLLHKLRWLSW